MIIDRENLQSDVQVITVTANSTDVLDLLATADAARGVPFRARCQVDTTFTAAGAATMQTQLVLSASNTLSAPEIINDSTAIGKATLVAGYIITDVVLPQTDLRFLGWIYTVATGPMTAGAASAFLLRDTETSIARRQGGFTGYP